MSQVHAEKSTRLVSIDPGLVSLPNLPGDLSDSQYADLIDLPYFFKRRCIAPLLF
jgi:hypothetical protein